MRLIRAWLISLLGVLLLGCNASMPPSSSRTSQEGVPLSIQVPAGQVPVMPAHYQGVLVYTCTVKNNLYDWMVTETQGSVDFGEWGYGRHEGDAYTWRLGDSLVHADVIATWSGGDRTDAPWELYKVHAATGTTPLTKATYIQRLDTSGGGYPVVPCTRERRNVQDFIRVQGYFMLWTSATAR